MFFDLMEKSRDLRKLNSFIKKIWILFEAFFKNPQLALKNGEFGEI